ncbi:FtsK/SpoIIIE domain-containing protein [Microbacterium sp. C7(2022)]|uniref:FtsK/SpoIIIE domain-containing protein n=1 Tax=Microbacterium sp. C7(2022) TaxID=2992759 RepID=UPI00237BEECF|nr:FtsK/SpoIIIE domain-containing protein [Microbacterium sp. C7(2022)]MDE0547211.1 FtsK/SpoIIIE domain-containing protein [Microbacterium sp. C7(2022)]
MPPSFPPAPAGHRASSLTFDALVHDDHEDEILALPEPWTAPPRPPLPLIASIVPLIGAVVLWVVTGSPMMLWFALLGPLIAVAAQVDAARGARRGRRRAEADAATRRAEIEACIERRHVHERRRQWAHHPDIAAIAADDAEIWRATPERADVFVIGRGAVPSSVRTSGGGSDPDSLRLRQRASSLADAPVLASTRGGAVVLGPDPLAAAVLRAWVMQVCAIVPPDVLRITADLSGEHSWAAHLPHCDPRFHAQRTLALVSPGGAVPDADIVFARARPGDPLPPRCAAVVTAREPRVAWLEAAGSRISLSLEALSAEQAGAFARVLDQRAELTWAGDVGGAAPVMLGDVLAEGSRAASGTLAAALGRGEEGVLVLDLVSDGPHAVVAGVTGSGKSELLITWVLSLSATYSTAEVNFLLADFKGGTAFDCLIDVPHVTGVITDLDGTGARRAIESLRAEVRWREAVIARAGARDVRDPRVELARLVVVVDEFAALLGDHPELHAVFTDVAARGRALGIHLILGTQRITGVVRDNLLANCPLRVSLRVTDPADSRAILGVEDAAALPGGESGRGRALVRRAADVRCHSLRVALSHQADVDAVRDRGGAQPKRPWLPELPREVSLAELRTRFPDAPGILLGLADEPARQHQGPVGVDVTDRGILFLGAPAKGKSNALALVASQAPGDVVWVPRSAEHTWDVLSELVDRPPASGTMVVIDDLDTIPPRFGAEYAPAVVELLEEVVRGAGGRGQLVVASAQRLTGAIARVADLFPHRVILPMASRGEHLAAGGEAEHYAPDAPPGRAIHRGVPIQVARSAPRERTESVALPFPEWSPEGLLTGFVARRSPAARQALSQWQRHGVIVCGVDDYAQRAEVSDERVLVVGEPDEWQRHWRLLTELRGEHDFVIDASCAPEFRLLAGQRALPPFLEAGRGRAWLLRAGADAKRIVLPTD